MIKTPAYVFDIDQLKKRIEVIRKEISGLPLTFSVKANSFITSTVSEMVSHVEVCSPGELDICKRLQINPEQIIYSGVMKEEEDIREAIRYRSHILTAESKTQFDLISSVAAKEDKSVNVLLRISSDNQFGMDPKDICTIVCNRDQYPNITLYGFHYYSGTQKKQLKQIETDIQRMMDVIEKCKFHFGYKPKLVEYGPGLGIEYFKENGEKIDLELLKTAAPALRNMAKKVPLGIEMGRFIAAGCGIYYTKVKDIKQNYGILYAILDGGSHQLKYHGQMMAMQTPVIVQQECRGGKRHRYQLCGSLCTVADVLAKDVELDELRIGDVLEFHRCGAYSVTEAPGLFLSRDLPYIYLRENGKDQLIRDFKRSSEFNTPDFQLR